MKFDSIIPLIKQGGKADCGVSNFTITDERKQEIDFTDPYIDSNQGVVVKADSDKTTAEALNADGVKIACQSGTTGEAWAQENMPKATIVSLDDPVQAVTGVSIAAVTITDERMESVDFSEPYLDSNQAIVVAKGSSETEETLNDASKQVVCQGGTTGDEWIGENLPDAVRVPVDDVTAALTGVQTGLYQAMVVDLPVASYMLSQSFSDLEIVKEIPTGEQYGIAVSKDNPELTQAVNKALEDMKSDGTMKEIETKWFGSEI